MFSYDDPTETSITVGGTQYKAVPAPDLEGSVCYTCIFDAEVYRLLVPDFCNNVPCTWRDRKDNEDVIFIEVIDDSLRR